MRLKLILPVVKPDEFEQPKRCANSICSGKHFIPFQEVKKNLRDTVHQEVTARRYKCVKCGCTFRVYPQGVQAGQISQRVKGMAVMLYLLGLSYGAVVLMLEALGVYLGKTSVYRSVQATAEQVPGMKRTEILAGYRTRALGADLTSVKCKGKWLPIGVMVDPISGLVLSIDHLSGEDAQTLQEWIEPIADVVGAHTLVTDDADAFKQAADQSGLDQQVCKSHVVRNTEELLANLSQAIEMNRDTSLIKIQIEPAQALTDLKRLGELIHSRLPEQSSEIQALYQRYAQAAAPKKSRTASIAYRMRNLFFDRWNLWPRLTFYRTWKDRNGQPILDGTNNADERAIGWWVKERYHSMRTYKRERSVLRVSRLIAYCGNHLSDGLNLASIVAGLVLFNRNMALLYLCPPTLPISEQSQKPYAVFAASDMMAIGAMRALREANLRIPEDVAVIGFDDIPASSRTEPPLTTVHQSASLMGMLAVDTLIDIINHPGSEIRRIIIATEFVIRSSCGTLKSRPEGGLDRKDPVDLSITTLIKFTNESAILPTKTKQ